VRVDQATGGVPADLVPFVGDGSQGSGFLCGAGASVVTAEGFSAAPTCGEAELV